jgi:hypothetical protein
VLGDQPFSEQHTRTQRKKAVLALAHPALGPIKLGMARQRLATVLGYDPSLFHPKGHIRAVELLLHTCQAMQELLALRLGERQIVAAAEAGPNEMRRSGKHLHIRNLISGEDIVKVAPAEALEEARFSWRRQHGLARGDLKVSAAEWLVPEWTDSP